MKIASLPPNDTWDAVAAACGIRRESLRDHYKKGAAWFPTEVVKKGGSGRLSIVAGGGAQILAAYRAQMAGRKSGGDGGDWAASLSKLKAAGEAEKLKQAQMLTRRMQREEAIAEGNILPRDEYTLFARECVTLCRDQFMTMPKQLAALVGRKERKKLIVEGERMFRRALAQLEAALTTGPERE